MSEIIQTIEKQIKIINNNLYKGTPENQCVVSAQEFIK
jgi:hypothetical protein